MTASAPVAPPSLDPVDRILLQEATAWLAEPNGDLVVVDAVSGALVQAAADLAQPGRRIRVSCDSFRTERQVAVDLRAAGVPADWPSGLSADLCAGATVVLLRLPKSLAALDELAQGVARHADSRVRVYAAGRVKHMSHGMNRVLLQHFGTVSASRGQQKSRVLLASEPRPAGPPTYPVRTRHDDLGLTVCAHGAAFAGAAVDLGTRFLAQHLAQLPPDARDVIDLGSGTGILATLAARLLPAAHVRAVDDSRAACASTQATVEANGVADQVTVARTDVLAGVADASVDLVLCNPPFHRGTARDTDVALAMFAAARRVLRPGGELWTVFNSHLPYLSTLRRVVGQTSVLGQNPSYFVTRSRVPQRS